MKPLIRQAVVPLVLMLSACTAGADPTPGPSSEAAAPTAAPTADTASPEGSPSAGEPTEEEPGVEQQAALDVAEQYFTLHNQLAKAPEEDLQPLLDITTGLAEQQVLYEFEELRLNGEKRVGDAVHHLLDVGELDEFEGDPFILVVACTDSADSDIVNAETGESVVSFDGTLTLDWLMGVVEQNGEWLVSTLETTLSDSCDA